MIEIRAGGPDDAPAILDLWDRAIAWLVARGQLGQWGSAPASSRAATRRHVERWVAGDGIRIAELGGDPVGVIVIGAHPAHVDPIDRPELYVEFLVTSRAHQGMGIGTELVERAAAEARAAGAEVLRVDCWAGAPELVAWYQRQGFVRAGTFTVSGWQGQIFQMVL